MEDTHLRTAEVEVVTAVLADGTKWPIDLSFSNVTNADDFFRLVGEGQLRWARTKAEVPSLINLWHVIRFERKYA